MKSKTITGIVTGALFSVGVVSGINYGFGNTKIEDDLLYQGYNYMGEGVERLVFDEKPLTERNGLPELVVSGNSRGLEIGKKYNVTVESPKWFGDDFVSKIEESISYFSK